MNTQSENSVPKADPGPGMVTWLTYLDSRLADQDRRIVERDAVVDKQFMHYNVRFDRLEDLIRENSRDASSTREEVTRNGLLASLVAAAVSLAARYMEI